MRPKKRGHCVPPTRDHLIHGYDVIDHRVLWDAVQIDIPRLIEAIDELLS
jgi:uncharacterized protein with HEPN domain